MQIAVKPHLKGIPSGALHDTTSAANGVLEMYEQHPSGSGGRTDAGNMSLNAKILIVDDDEFSLWMTCATLRNAGFARLNSTTDPEKVLSRCDTFGPDLILIDLLMPRLDGISLIETLRRRLPTNRNVPILVITGNLNEETRQKAASMGVNDFVTKPFDPQTLLLSVRNLLDNRQCSEPQPQASVPGRSGASSLNRIAVVRAPDPTGRIARPAPAANERALSETAGLKVSVSPKVQNFRLPPIALSNASGETLRLLIAEDSVDDRVLLKHYLKDTHYQQTFVEDGERAVALFETGAYDLILMDINMPRMDGLAATRLTRALEEKRRLAPTPILALTGSCMAQDVAACVNAGCNAHLAKPISKQELLSKIDRYTKLA